MKKIPVIIDVDTGTDDAVAIAEACYFKNLDVRLIACGSGNTDVENVTRNTLNILQYINRGEVLVAKGVGEKFKPNNFSLSVHGKTGMGEFDFPPLTIKEIDTPAEEKIVEILNNSSEKITIIALGPLSNIARAIEGNPEIVSKIERIVISGGLIEKLDEGQFPYTSFNIAYDDEAVKLLLCSGVKIDIVPSNLGHSAYLTYEEVYKTKIANSTGECFEKIFRDYHDRHVKNGVATHDLCACMYVAFPKIFTTEKAYSCIKKEGKNNEGIMKFDFFANSPNATVVTGINIKKAKRIYFRTLNKMP